jgi:urease accessory protein
VFAPDPVQAFAGSTYEQHQTFDLAPGASLFLLDWYTAGRVAMGERWAFNSYKSRNDVRLDGALIFQDALALNALDGPLASRHRLGRFNCLATLLLLGPAFQTQATHLLERIAALEVSRRSDLVLSASPITGGAVLRLASTHFEQVAAELQPLFFALGDLLADNPWSRKW